MRTWAGDSGSSVKEIKQQKWDFHLSSDSEGGGLRVSALVCYDGSLITLVRPLPSTLMILVLFLHLVQFYFTCVLCQ